MSDNTLPLHNVELEEAFLAALIADGEQIDMVRALLNPQDFYIVRYGWIYEAMCKIADGGQLIDYTTVLEQTRRDGRLDEIGGPVAITRLLTPQRGVLSAVAPAARIKGYAMRRKLLAALGKIAEEVHKPSVDDAAVLDFAHTSLQQITLPQEDTRGGTVAEAMASNYKRVEESRGSGVCGLATRWTHLDHLLGGLQDTDLIIVAGRPGMGKTSWLISLFYTVMRYGLAVPALFSMEMSQEQVAQRMVAMNAANPVSVQLQRNPGKMSEEEWKRFVSAQSDGALVGMVDDTPALTPERLAAKAKRWQATHGVNLIMVDYLQLMRGTGQNRTQEVGHISRGLKALAKEIRCPVLAAAQLSRAVENRQDKRPQLSDLRESGDIENDADVVMFLYRDDYYNAASERPSQVDVIVSKHRHGPTGTVSLFFKAEQMRIANLHKEEHNAGYHAAGAVRGVGV